jgi:hypothetical protein
MVSGFHTSVKFHLFLSVEFHCTNLFFNFAFSFSTITLAHQSNKNETKYSKYIQKDKGPYSLPSIIERKQSNQILKAMFGLMEDNGAEWNGT